MTQSEVNTGYGTYGPKTKAAVTKIQKELGIDTAGYDGYWGPKTIAAVQEGISNQGGGEGGGYTGGGVLANNPTQIPTGTKFTESDAYKSLSPELKELVNMGFNVFFEGGEPEAQIFADSLTQAQALADPYTKSQLALTKAEIGLSLAKIADDYQLSKDILDRTRKELADDLKTGKETLSLEEQSDVARTLRNYDEDMLTIADQAAEKGITFATGARSRALAEERRGEQYQDVVQSTRRQYNLKQKELALRAARGDQEAQDQLKQLESNKKFKLQEIGQGAEKLIGSLAAGEIGVQGFTPVGGALGDIEQQRRKSILDIASLGINT